MNSIGTGTMVQDRPTLIRLRLFSPFRGFMLPLGFTLARLVLINPVSTSYFKLVLLAITLLTDISHSANPAKTLHGAPQNLTDVKNTISISGLFDKARIANPPAMFQVNSTPSVSYARQQRVDFRRFICPAIAHSSCRRDHSDTPADESLTPVIIERG